ncbi:hypothetical protein [Sphingomonas sp. AX6]|uniref:hypothetical protein n=1 Tax=Sphingomonas sp. AX6 TaxID=2653171 RepID=UPI0012F130AC|nr:hypothetical protein [Sphingomonas sp. AX6]VXC97158.1 hypothetical protein SPHINGOAX6_70674 [Sphingomonas sp. AX6]
MSDINTTIDKAQAKASDAYASSKQSVKKAATKVEKSAKDNPLAVVAGGIAIGAVIGALLPKTQREEELLGTVGKRLAEGATAAAIAARDTGKSEFASLKPDTSSAKDKAGSIAAHIFDAAKAAAVEAGQRK